MIGVVPSRRERKQRVYQLVGVGGGHTKATTDMERCIEGHDELDMLAYCRPPRVRIPLAPSPNQSLARPLQKSGAESRVRSLGYTTIAMP
jgi:hypothetical protein